MAEKSGKVGNESHLKTRKTLIIFNSRGPHSNQRNLGLEFWVFTLFLEVMYFNFCETVCSVIV